jgi:hypothetical protein
MADSSNPRTIGNMNGPWAILLRLALATYPCIIAWSVWVTVQEFEDIAFRKQGDRFTATDAARMSLEIEKRFSTLPPDDWKNRIVAIESNQQMILVKLGVIESKLDRKP